MQNYWNVSDNGLSSICGLKDLACLKNASSTLKSLYYASLADVEVMQLLQKKGIDCNCPAGDIQSSIIHSISKLDKKKVNMSQLTPAPVLSAASRVMPRPSSSNAMVFMIFSSISIRSFCSGVSLFPCLLTGKLLGHASLELKVMTKFSRYLRWLM